MGGYRDGRVCRDDHNICFLITSHNLLILLAEASVHILASSKKKQEVREENFDKCPVRLMNNFFSKHRMRTQVTVIPSKTPSR